MKKWIMLILTLELSLVAQVFGAAPTTPGEMYETDVYAKQGLTCAKEIKHLLADEQSKDQSDAKTAKAGSAEVK